MNVTVCPTGRWDLHGPAGLAVRTGGHAKYVPVATVRHEHLVGGDGAVGRRSDGGELLARYHKGIIKLYQVYG